MYIKTTYKGKPAKLEIFNKNHKLFRSLPVHKEALELGLRIPKLYSVEKIGNKFHKYSEWIEGKTIHEEMEANHNMIEIVCADLARYVNELFNANQIAAVDNHFRNFVWNNDSVIYVDLKKLLHETYDEHIMRMSKLCLKNCRGKYKRKKVLAFLKGYIKYGDIMRVINDCNERNWTWFGDSMEPIKLEEIMRNVKDEES